MMYRSKDKNMKYKYDIKDFIEQIKEQYDVEYLRKQFANVYFLIGTAYAGKSTMIKMLSKKYDGVFLKENYIDDVMKDYGITPETEPNLCYFDTMSSWDEFVNRTPKEYYNWMQGCSIESTPIEISEILKNVEKYPDKKVFVDTSIPMEILHKISDKEHVLVMLCDPEVSVNSFFDREDIEKQFIYKVIKASPNKNALDNYRNILREINSKKHYDEFLNSGFNVLLKDDKRTPEETLKIVEDYFGFNKNIMKLSK